jgi:2,3-dihydroxybiphenyl 1,2-dioxygenase
MSEVEQLGYVVFEVSDLERWEHFATHVLGLMLSTRTDDGFTLRNDSWKHRIYIREGEADDCVAVGLMVADESAAQSLRDRLEENDVETSDASDELIEAREVDGMFTFIEPAGQTMEVFWGPTMSDEPVKSKTVKSGFVADELGFGHIVMRANDREESERFFCDIVGFTLSDHIICDLGGYKVDIAFTHVNPRHHSVAFGEKLPKSIHHFLIQVKSLDDVGAAYDRAVDNGVRITQTIGRHPNDRMVSFYAQSPSGFEFEYGWGAREVDDATWEPTTYDHISEWGHRRPPYRRPKDSA